MSIDIQDITPDAHVVHHTGRIGSFGRLLQAKKNVGGDADVAGRRPALRESSRVASSNRIVLGEDAGVAEGHEDFVSGADAVFAELRVRHLDHHGFSGFGL